MTLLNMIVPDISSNGLLRDKSRIPSLSYSNQEPCIPEFITPNPERWRYSKSIQLGGNSRWESERERKREKECGRQTHRQKAGKWGREAAARPQALPEGMLYISYCYETLWMVLFNSIPAAAAPVSSLTQQPHTHTKTTQQHTQAQIEAKHWNTQLCTYTHTH